jgi:hypothetical protein
VRQHPNDIDPVSNLRPLAGPFNREAKAFMRIDDAKLRRCIADLVEKIAAGTEAATGARRRSGK